MSAGRTVAALGFSLAALAAVRERAPLWVSGTFAGLGLLLLPPTRKKRDRG